LPQQKQESLQTENTIATAMDCIKLSHLKYISYLLGAIMLLCVAAEANTFLDEATYDYLIPDPDNPTLVEIFRLLWEVSRFTLKVFNFSFCVYFTLRMLGVRTFTVPVETERELGWMAVVATGTWVFSYRFALARTNWLARAHLWWFNVLDYVLDIW
jgi:hypothetical protein